jgi:hypothetical protein
VPALESVSPETRQRIEELGTADIVLGLPTYNNASTIEPVIHGIQTGLRKHFDSLRSVIIHSDGGSKDGTPERMMEAATNGIPVVQAPYPVYPVQKLTTPPIGVPGKSSAYRTIFELATQLGAGACAIVDCDVSTMSPEVVEWLIRPALDQQFDFVAPWYARDKFDGTITNSIVYPMMRALYGKRVRQPIGADFCLSSKLVQRCLTQSVWNSDIARSAIDIWVTTQAISRGFRVCQAFLGAKVRAPHDGSADLSAMISPILGAVFFEMEKNLAVWQKVRGSEGVVSFGTETLEAVEPVVLDVKRMIDSFRIGQQNLQEIWARVLPPVTMVELKKLARRADQDFRLQDAVWVRIVYDFSLAHHLRVISRDHLLQAFVPLYWAWLASFAKEMQDVNHQSKSEERIEQLCLRYEAEKPYLISRWRWPDRFNP